MPVGEMKQLLFGDRQYITVTSLTASPLSLSLFSPLIHCSWQSSSLHPLSHCLTGAEWQPFVLLLLLVKVCILVPVCRMFASVRECVRV